jgi:uncharacterized membrane protein
LFEGKGLNRGVKKLGEFVVSRLLAGVLVVTPIYIAALLLLKATKSLSRLVRPLAKLLPEWLPAEDILSLLLVLVVCFLIGLAIRTPAGRTAWERIENALFRRIPGYELFRSLTQRLAGETHDAAWKPALAEIEEALVPAFIIEELDDGRFTVFVPSVPTPFAGAVYILSPDRVHPLNIPLTRAIKAVSRWGSGCKDLVAAMEQMRSPSSGADPDDVRTVLKADGSNTPDRHRKQRVQSGDELTGA